MNIDENVVESIVKRVVSQLSTETASAQTCPSGGDWGVFESMNDAVDAAVEAQREYLNRSMHDRACYVQAIRDVVLDQENLEYISVWPWRRPAWAAMSTSSSKTVWPRSRHPASRI